MIYLTHNRIDYEDYEWMSIKEWLYILTRINEGAKHRAKRDRMARTIRRRTANN